MRKSLCFVNLLKPHFVASKERSVPTVPGSLILLLQQLHILLNEGEELYFHRGACSFNVVLVSLVSTLDLLIKGVNTPLKISEFAKPGAFFTSSGVF